MPATWADNLANEDALSASPETIVVETGKERCGWVAVRELAMPFAWIRASLEERVPTRMALGGEGSGVGVGVADRPSCGIAIVEGSKMDSKRNADFD